MGMSPLAQDAVVYVYFWGYSAFLDVSLLFDSFLAPNPQAMLILVYVCAVPTYQFNSIPTSKDHLREGSDTHLTIPISLLIDDTPLSILTKVVLSGTAFIRQTISGRSIYYWDIPTSAVSELS